MATLLSRSVPHYHCQAGDSNYIWTNSFQSVITCQWSFPGSYLQGNQPVPWKHLPSARVYLQENSICGLAVFQQREKPEGKTSPLNPWIEVWFWIEHSSQSYVQERGSETCHCIVYIWSNTCFLIFSGEAVFFCQYYWYHWLASLSHANVLCTYWHFLKSKQNKTKICIDSESTTILSSEI